MSSKCPPMPDVHTCAQLMLENAQLKKKVHKMKAQNASLQQKLDQLVEKQKIENLLREYVTTHNMETQTETVRTGWSCQKQMKKVTTKEDESERVNKLLAMHNGLMRRYERELKNNMQHVETITTLQLQVNELEQNLKEAKLSALSAQRSFGNTKHRHDKKDRRKSWNQSSDEDDLIQIKKELKNVKKERDSWKEESKKIKTELKGLDHGFFEEVEDLKYALQQAAKLNQQYEKSLRRICAKFGLPYPFPEEAKV